VGSPWKGYNQNRKGEIYKCEPNKPGTSCQALNLQSKLTFPIIPSEIQQKVLSVHRAISYAVKLKSKFLDFDKYSRNIMK